MTSRRRDRRRRRRFVASPPTSAVATKPPPRPGSLTIVGTGIAVGDQLTAAGRLEMERADELLYLAAEPIASAFLRSLNGSARNLFPHYRPGVARDDIYEAIAEDVLTPVRAGGRVCFAIYGHPGFLAQPAHLALARARAEGFDARMLPAVSALDCLVADLAFDPADSGLHLYEATEFLTNGRRPDPTAALVLWQLGVLGMTDWGNEPDAGHLAVLVEYLGRWYPPDHEVVVYEASPYPVAGPRILHVPLRTLPGADVPAMSTLYVPPAERATADAELTRRLGL